jgi:anti-sigma factor RsiW
MNRDHLSLDVLVRRLDGELPTHALPAIEEHLAGCASCRAWLARLRAASGAIDDYAAALLDSPAPTARRQALRGALEERAAARRKLAPARLAIAASLLLASGIALWIYKQPKRPTAVSSIAADGFVALPYSDENLRAEGAVVLQVELPRSAAALAGMPVSNGPSDGRVRAEVIVGADGLARAIRFLN